MFKFKKIIAVFTAGMFAANAVSFADMIKLDGKTQTTINQQGNIYDISTKTVVDNTGFNSFKKFNVDAGTTVNLQLTENMANLVNLVSDEKTSIYGTLNSFKNGKIAGNVFFLNPNGIIVGETGVVNVGALTLATPTKEFLESVINSDKQVSSILTKAILAGDMPINETGLISVKGKINAFNGVQVSANDVDITENGTINTKYSVDDIVNLGDIEDVDVKIKDGKVVIEAVNKVTDEGAISADGIVNNSGQNGDVTIEAKEVVLDGAKISNVNVVKIEGTESVEIKNKTDISVKELSDIKSQNTTLKDSNIVANNVKLVGTETVEIDDNAYIKGNIVSVEAKELTLGSNTIESDKKFGTSTDVEIKSENITITENQNLNKNYLLTTTKDITVNEDVSIKTNGNNIVFDAENINIKKNAVLDTVALSNDVAGGIFMEAKTIIIGDGVSLNTTPVNNPSMGGNIILLAKNEDKGYIYYTTESKIDIGKNANINGKNILIAAIATNEKLFAPDKDDNAFEEFMKQVGNFTLGFLSDISLFGGYVNVTLKSVLNIGEETVISATENLDIKSEVNSNVAMSVYGNGAAVVYGSSSFLNELNIDKNVKLFGNNVNLTAQSNSDFDVSAMALSTAATPVSDADISLAIGIVEGNTGLYIKDGVEIVAQKNANITAQTDKSFSVDSSASAYNDGVVGAAVTYANSNVTNSIDLNGKITAQNTNVDAIINAKSDNIGSSTETGDPILTNFFIDKMNASIDKLKAKFTKVNTAKESNVKFSFTGAVTYNDNNNTSQINLGKNSSITSSQDTNIFSHITQSAFRQKAEASVSSSKNHKKENSASAGVSLLYNTNKAIINAEDGASIDAGDNLNIESKYYMPFDITYIDFVYDFQKGEYGDLGENLIDKINENLGIQSGFFTTWANSSIETDSENESSGGIGVAGAVNIAFFNTDSKVNLGAVKINQHIAGNNVNINALSDTFALNLSGLLAITFFGNTVKKGLGASYQQMEYNTNIEATIADNAKITANDNFSLEAKDEQMDITVSVAGGKAETFGFEGTFNWVKANNNTVASVGNAEVKILNATDKTPSIYASDDGLYINVAGAVLLSENIGVGLGIALTDIERNTQAYLGSNYTSNAFIALEDLNSFKSNKGLDITAVNKGAVFAYSLAATASTQSNDKTAPKSSSGGDYGIGISGAYGGTNITDTALAYIHNAKYEGNGKLNIDAQEKTKINTVSPGATMASGSSVSGGVAGSVSINNIANTAMAFIDGKSKIETDYLKLNSYSNSDILSVAASLALAISKGSGEGFSLAGSVSINETENKISSYISDSNIETSDTAEAKAKDESNILAVAGGVNVSKTVGIGASVAINTIKNTVYSYIDTVKLISSNIIFSSMNFSDIKGIAGTLGVATGKGLAAAVSVTINEIANKTKSFIDNSYTVSKEGDTSLSSKDESTMYSVAGGAAGSVEGFALSEGAGKSIIDNEIESYINDSTVSSKKDINIKAESNSEIQTASAGVSVAGGPFAGSGSLGINEITTIINAKIKDSYIDSKGNVNVEAMSANDINFYGGSLSFSSSISGGGTLVLNTVKDKATAEINNSYVKAKDVNVKTDVNDIIKIYSVNGGASGSGSLEASITFNSIENDSIAQIKNSSKIEATGNVSVTADNKVKTNVNGGGLAVAGSGAIGIVDETTIFANTTKANIENSTVDAAGNVTIKTDSKQIYNAIIASGGLAGTVGVAGNVAVVIMECINEAIIKDSSVNAKADITVEAKDKATIGDGEDADDIFIVGSLGVGTGGAGVAGSVAVTNIKNNTVSKIVDSSVNTTKKLSVKAITDYLTEIILPAVGSGLYGGLGLVTGVGTIDATTQAFISETENGNTIINGDENYKGYNQSVEVDATSKSQIINVASSAGVGYVGIGAGINVNTIDNKTVAAIGDNVEVSAQKDITVNAKNTKKVKDFVVGLGAGIAGLSGSISVSNFGSAIDSESNTETGDTKDTINNELSRITDIDFSDGENSFFENVNTDLSKYQTNVNSTFDTTIEKDNSTSAFIGKNAIVKAGNKLEVKAEDELIMDNVAGSVSLGYAALGASVLIGNLNSSTKAYIDSGAEVESKNILIKAVSNVTSNALSFLGAGSMYGSLGAVVAKTNSINDTLAYSNAKQLKGTEKIEIIADATADENSQTVGALAGAAAVGASVSIIDKDGTTSAFIGDNSKAEGKNLTVNAKNNFDIYAEAEAGAGGIVSGSGAVAVVTVNDVINATIGKNSILNIVNVLNLLTNSSVYANAKVIGANLGGLTVGVSYGEANIKLANNVIVYDGAKIKADKAIFVAEQTKADTDVESMAVVGALIGGSGAVANSSVEGEVKTTVGNDADINTVSGMQIDAKSNSKQETTSKRYAGGVISGGGNVSDVVSDIDTQVEVKDGANLKGKNIKIQSVSNNELYTETESGSGGVVEVSVAKATTENTSDTNIILGQASITGDSVEILAENTTSQDSAVYMTSVGALQGSGVVAENTSAQNVLVDFEGSKIISNKFITNAKNNFIKNKYGTNLDFTGGGFISATVNESNTEIKNTSKVIFDDDASITTVKDYEGNSTFMVNAYNNIKATDFGTLSSGGLVAVPTVVSKINNSINKAAVEIAKAAIKTANDLIINTKSDLDISSTANLSTYGAATVVHGESSAVSNVDNQIILKEGADVLSEGNTYLYLTKPYGDARAIMNLKAKTEIWNKSAAPFDEGSSSKAILNVNNLTDIQQNALLRGVDSIYMEGDIPIHNISSVYDYVSTYGDIASSNKVSETKTDFYTKVNVDGELSTGINNMEKITINVDREIDFNGTPEVGYEITAENLAENLIKELERLENLQTEYSSNDILKEAYQKDIDRVKDDLNKLGLLDENKNLVKKDKDDLLNVDFITFDNIYANRGDIVIVSDDLDGSGTISAQANAEVVIENNSDLFLRLNDVKIAGSGNGIIFYNTNAVKTKQDIEQMNTKVKNTKFDNGNLISQQEKTTPLIDISSNYENDGRTTNVELLGNIENISGLVRIDALGTIYAKGNILGETIDIKTQADIVQTYTEGFRHIGGAPEAQWASVIDSGKINTFSDKKPNITETNSIIGNNVFISGRYLNINGLIQAGIADYNLVIDDDNLSLKIGSVQDAKNDYLSKLEAHDPSVTSLYQLSDKYGSATAYYNVETNKIEVANINVSGGHLELYGEIINTSLTGAGELRVLDGYTKLNIENNSSYDLVLNSINIGNRVEGVIKITDISKKGGDNKFLETIYTKLGNNIKQVDSTTRDENGNPNNVVVIDGLTAQYNPSENLRYKWMTGQEKLTRTTKYFESKSFWGMDWLVPDEEAKKTEIKMLNDTPLSEGSVLITDVSGNKYNYEYTYEEYTLSDVLVGRTQGSYSSGWWIFSTKTYWLETVQEKGTKLYRTHSIKASNPIKINFVGYDSSQATISSANNIYLNGYIKNATGDVSLTSVDGSIINNGCGAITAQNITLNAKTGIGNNSDIIIDLKGGMLNAVTDEGNINLYSKGNFVFDNVTNKNGNISVTSMSDIIGATEKSSIKGNNLYLASKTGSVGTADNFVNIQVNELSANVSENMFVNQKGDLGLKEVKVTKELNLFADGNVYDNNTNDFVDTRTEQEKQSSWNRMDLLKKEEDGGAGWKEEQLKYAVNSNRFDNSSSNKGDDEQANVTANKVTITATGSIGKEEGTKVIDLTDYSSLSTEDKKLLATTEKDNIFFEYDNGELTTALIVLKEDVDIISKELTLKANGNIYVGSKDDININRIESGDNAVITINSLGGIYNINTENKPNITGKNLKIESLNGTIGTKETPMVLSLTGNLIASAKDGIYLNSVKDLAINTVYSQNVIEIITDKNITNAYMDGHVNLNAKEINIQADNIGEDNSYIGVKLIDEDSCLNIKSAGNIYINNTINDGDGDIATVLKIGNIDVANNANIKSQADILNVNEKSKITANNLNFVDVKGDIGKVDDKISVDADKVSANATGSVNLKYLKNNPFVIGKILSQNGNINLESNGDMVIEEMLFAQKGDINLNSNGSVNDLLSDDKTSIFANNINIKADSIGTKDNYLGINTSVTEQGFLNAETEQNINIASSDKTLDVSKVFSKKSDVSLIADKSLTVDKLGKGKANIKANNITIKVKDGQIGSRDNFVVVDVNNEGGKVNLQAANGINLKQSDYIFYSDYVYNTNGDVNLDLKNSDVRIKDIKVKRLNIAFAHKDNINDIMINNSNVKNLTIYPVSNRLHLIDAGYSLMNINSILMHNHKILDSIAEPVKLISFNNIGIE